MLFLITLLFFTLLSTNTYAQTFYSDYEPVTNFFTKEDELHKIEIVTLYNKFYVENNNIGYYPETKKIKNSKIDYNNFITKTNYSLMYDELTTNYETLCENNNYFLNKIEFKNLRKDLKLNEIILKYNKEIINYNLTISNYNGKIDNLFNNDLNDDEVIIKSGSALILMLEEPVMLEDLEIDFFSQERDSEKYYFELVLNEEKGNTLVFEKNLNIKISFKNDYIDILNNKKIYTIRKCLSYYTREQKLYMFYQPLIKYTDEYLEVNSDNNLDYQKSKIIEKKYERNKLVLSDNIIIYDLEELASKVILKTNNNFTIKHNININYSGIYDLNIYYKDKLIGNQKIEYIKKDMKEQTKNDYNIPTTRKIEKVKTTEIQTKIKKITTSSRNITTKIKSQEIDDKDYITKSIIIILIIILSIFEFILLYVKRKYYNK